MAVVIAVVAIAGLVVFSGTSANEGSLSLRANLTGFQEVTPKLSGAGTFTGTMTSDKLTYKLTYSGLTPGAFMAHIHFGERGVNGGIFIWLCGSTKAPGPAGTPTCPAGGGTVSGTATAASVQALNADGTDQNLNAGDFEGAMRIIRSGDAYVNVHTTRFPGGEIRGQVQVEED